MKRALLPLMTLLLTFGFGPVGAAPNPYQIYARARSVWLSAHYPTYLSYTIAVTVEENGVSKANHYRAIYDALHDRAYVEAVSEEERADPHVPTGIDMSVDPKRQFRTLFKKRVGRPETPVDYLGVPLLAPNYSFGIAPYIAVASSQTGQAALVEAIRRQFNDPMPAQKLPELSRIGGLKVIGDVVSTKTDYLITYDGIESIDGCQAYHLSMRPLHAPDRLRLRELWIDTQTFATCRLVTQGNFESSPVPWTITFASIGGAQYISSENADRPVRVGPHVYEGARIDFEDVATTQPSRYLWNPVAPSKQLLVEPSAR